MSEASRSRVPPALPAEKPATVRSLDDVGPIERNTLHDQIYERLRQAIVSGVIVPGVPLSVRGLADRLGTSSMPVRQALRRLVAERALETLPNRSTILPVPSAERFAEIRRLRIALEGMMVEAAAAHIEMTDLDRLTATEGEMEIARDAAPMSYLALHSDFHFSIYRAAGMPTTLSIVESLWLQSGPMLHHVVRRKMLGTVRGQHKAILTALRRRDGAAARRAVETDIHEPGEVVLEYLRQHEQHPRPPAR